MKYFTVSLLLYSLATLPALSIAEPTELDCLIKPEMFVELSSSIDTVVDKILIKPGDTVQEGQVLVQLESSTEVARLKLAQLQAESSTEIMEREVQLNYARINHKRVTSLYDKNMAPQLERDKAAADLALAEIELSKAHEKKRQAALNLELVQAQLGLKYLRSPINGIVVDIYAKAGESVADRSIMKLAQINPLRVELIAPTEYFGLIYPGMVMEIQPERPKDVTLKTTVTMVDQIIDPASGTFTVRMALPNTDDQLVGGVNCIARFDLDENSALKNSNNAGAIDLIDVAE